jgi:hypothetical protein
MNFEGFKALRDARGLNSDEIAFLFVALSRGDELFGTWQTNAADMGLSKRGYYDTRAALLAKRLITVARKYNGTSVYAVDLARLAEYSPCGNETGHDSHMENEDSRMGNDDSRSGETKKNTKKNRKKNVTSKKNQTAPVVADAPTVTVDTASSLQGEDRKDSVPTMGTVRPSEDGHYLFEVGTGSGRYVLCESGVTGPVPLPETRTAAPVVGPDHETEMQQHRHKWAAVARAGNLRGDNMRQMWAEEAAINERHGVTADAW